MRTLAHLSDLHFGSVDPVVLEPLRRRMAALAPHLVVISGDLTQRARAEQFRQARAYLDLLPAPQIVVPGNHDVPLYDLFQRFFRPLAGYRRTIAGDLEPAFVDDEIAVLGVSTARSFAFKGGRIGHRQRARVRERFRQVGEHITKVLVTHHPCAASCGADVLLAGHLHVSRVGGGDRPHPEGAMAALAVHAGTALSRRTRTEANSFNLLRVARGHIEVDRYTLQGGEFRCAATHAFDRGSAGWHLAR